MNMCLSQYLGGGSGRQRRKTCHFIYLYCSRWSGLVPHCYCRLKSFTSFCLHWRSPLRMGDKYYDKLNSTYFFPSASGAYSRVRDRRRRQVEPGAGLSWDKCLLILSWVSAFTYIILGVKRFPDLKSPQLSLGGPLKETGR